MGRFKLPLRKERPVYQRVISCDKFDHECRSSTDGLDCSTKRGKAISPIFLKTEKWAKNDWNTVCDQLSKDEIQMLDPDYVIRTVRSSEYLAQPERRAKRNLSLIRQRLKWQKKYKVDSILSLCDGQSIPDSQNSELCTSVRIEQFRNFVLPLKIFGYSRTGVPIVKLSYSECNWKGATKIFKDKAELKTLIVLTLESLKQKLKEAKCRAATSDDSVFVTGKFILICDVSSFSLSCTKPGYSLQVFKIVPYIYKYYPDMVLKTYVVHNKHFNRGSRLLYPFVASRIIRRISFFSNEKEVVDKLLSVDSFEIGQLPVEFGGTFEGRYLVNVSSD